MEIGGYKMKIGAWKKTGDAPKRQRWRNKDNGAAVFVFQGSVGKGSRLRAHVPWTVQIDTGFSYTDRDFKRKENAMEYAIDYMKRNPY